MNSLSQKINISLYHNIYSDSTKIPNFNDGSTFTPDIVLYVQFFLKFSIWNFFLFMTKKDEQNTILGRKRREQTPQQNTYDCYIFNMINLLVLFNYTPPLSEAVLLLTIFFEYEEKTVVSQFCSLYKHR